MQWIFSYGMWSFYSFAHLLKQSNAVVGVVTKFSQKEAVLCQSKPDFSKVLHEWQLVLPVLSLNWTRNLKG